MWTYHTTKTSTQPRLTQSSKSTPHKLNQTTLPPLPQSTLIQVLEAHEPSLFQLNRSQPNHFKQGFSMTTKKIFYSLVCWSTSLCTSLRLQIPCTRSLPTPHIYSTFPITGVFGTHDLGQKIGDKFTQNRFFYGMFYSWFFAIFYRKTSKFGF